MRLLFHLGREPHLSEAEIVAVFERKAISFDVLERTNLFLYIETEQTVSTGELMHWLAGTIKISEALEDHNADVLGIATYLYIINPTGKIAFSLSGQTKKMALAVKKELKDKGRSVRYVEPKNTATILHNNLVERKTDLTVFKNTLFVTRAIQPIEELSERDFGRPGFDAKSGMLPPKLARMMINLAGVKMTGRLLDPFCGSGTVLTEALHVGVKDLVGSDLSEKAVEDTRKNLEWTIDKFQITNSNFQLYITDAAKINNEIKPQSIDAIVSEPYLGKPLRGNESELFLKKQVDELRRLYIDAFRAFAGVLKTGGRVVFVIPQYRVKDRWILIDCVKEIKKLGFSISPLLDDNESLLYWRKDQLVGRGVWRFVKQ